MTDSSGAAGPFSAPPEQAQSTEELAQLVDPFKGFRVDELTLSGVPEGLNGDEIRSGLVLAGTQGIFSREKPQLYASVLREDIDRVRLFLARQGYPRSQVVVRVDKHGDREARVRLRVSAGEPVRIVGIEIEGIDASQTAELRDRIPLERGRRVIDAEVRGASEDIRGWLEEQGHARAQVETYLLPRSTNEVAVRFAATPGPVYFVDQVRIVGTHEDLEPLARKTAGIEPGSRYSPKAIAQAHDQLRLLDLFRQIRIRPVFPDSSAQVDTTASARRTLDLEIEVSNISPRTLETGVGYWTDDFIRAHLAWKHRNLFGGGRGFRARGFYSLHSQDVTGGIWWPALIWPRTRGEIQNSLVRDSEESYRTYTERVDFSLLYRPTLKTNYRGGVRLSAVKLEKLTDDPEAFDESGGYATVFFGEALLDGADDRLNPSSG
ncbi:MAG: hypothetical protein KC729_13620, partial [Candidatus Eisenbacteria bacterium]|nr:hypothetical protein [Candidatus Eisenbacteria bacterium]